ncbi:MAG: lipid A deacylase LpxR family protein [Phycisphaeraceae bacterium]|nr:lipid A deacylase LpxR family protein [Phycisphaeraceae bacterium]
MTNRVSRPALAHLLTLLAIGGIAFSTGPAHADTGDASTDQPWRLSIYAENDSSPLKPNNNTDEHYTNGTGLSFMWRPDWARSLAFDLPLAPGDGPQRSAFGLVAGQKMFTPERISQHSLIRNDRPYAGYLFLGGVLQRDDTTTFDRARLELGVVGPSAKAEAVQETVHEMFDEVDPQGWDNQLEDEPAVQMHLSRKWRLGKDFEFGDHTLQFQAIPEVGLAVGTVHRHVEGAVTFRIGPRLPDDAGPDRFDHIASFTGDNDDRWWLYGYTRLAGQAVEHNIFLDGGTFEDGHGVDTKPLVGEITAGLAMGYQFENWTLNVHYAQTFITEQFDEQDDSDARGILAVSFRGTF